MTQPLKTVNTPKPVGGRRLEERRHTCLADGQSYAPSALLCFVAGPDTKVYLLQDDSWPGDKVYVQASAEALQQVIDDGRLAKALQAEVGPDLPSFVRRQLACRFYDLLGLAKKSGQLVAGMDKCVEALQKRKVTTLFVAADAAKNAEKAVDLATNMGVPVYRLGDKNGLSGATGVVNATVIGLRDKRKSFEVLWQVAQQMQTLQPR